MLRRRLQFGDGGNTAPFPSAVVVWGEAGELVSNLASLLKGAWRIPASR